MAWQDCDDSRMVRDAVEVIVKRADPIAALRGSRGGGSAGGHTPALWNALAEAGFAMPQVATADGGMGLGYVNAGIVAEVIGRHLGQTPLIATAMALELAAAAPTATRRAIMDRLAAGTYTVGIALDETRWHDPETIATCFRSADGEPRLLDGAKTAVLGGASADAFFVVARSFGQSAIVLVPRDATGLTVTPVRWIDGSEIARLVLTGVDCAPDMILAEGACAARAINRGCDAGRVLAAAELMGAAAEAFDRTLAYLRQRKQFGRRIGSFQALQHRAARLFVDLEMGRGVVRKALVALDMHDPEASELCSLAKWIATRTARNVMNEAVQMHGGIGVTDELDIGLFFKRSRVLGEQLGDDAFHRERLAKRRWHLC